MNPAQYKASPKVYVVVLNYQGWEDTVECLQSILQANYPNFQVVVIDNHSPNDSTRKIMDWVEGATGAVFASGTGSADSATGQRERIRYAFFHGKDLTLAKIKSTAEPLLLVQSDSNGGFAAGNNVFIRHVVNEDAFVWLLNPDMVAEREALRELVEAAGRLQGDVVLGSVVKSYHNPDQLLEFGGSRINLVTGTARTVLSREDVSKIDYISGGAFFTHLCNFKRHGLLPEEYFLYWEETDWCYRAKQRGVRFEVVESAICYDKGGTSIGRGFLAEYYYSLNALRFLKKYHAKYLPSVLFFNVFRMAKRLGQRRLSRAKAILKASTDFIAGSYKA